MIGCFTISLEMELRKSARQRQVGYSAPVLITSPAPKFPADQGYRSNYHRTCLYMTISRHEGYPLGGRCNPFLR